MKAGSLPLNFEDKTNDMHIKGLHCFCGIAIVSLIPFNYLNARMDEARHKLENACNKLEIFLMIKQTKKGGRKE
jgi:hypothetical protein